MTESSRIAGEMWRYLTDEERKVCVIESSGLLW